MKVKWRVVSVRRSLLVLTCFLMGFVYGLHHFAAVPVSSRVSPIITGNTNLPRVALMFNVDWGEECIPGILETLEEANVKVTFFVTGRWAKKYPDMVRAVAAEGHEIANHGYAHDHPAQLSGERMEALILDNEALLRRVLGEDPVRLFAPPYGEYTEETLRIAERLGYKTILWTVDTIDWQRPSPEIIRERALKATNGSLVLMHPTVPTQQALPEILSNLRNRGLEVVPVSRVIEKSP